MLIADILEFYAKVLPHLIPDRARNTNPVAWSERLQTGGDIDSVARYVVAVDDHVAEVDPDTKMKALLFVFHRFLR